MNEVINSVDFYVPKFNHKLKGHTKIVLSNPYKTDVIEHDNTIQSTFVEKQFRTLGRFNNSPWRNPTWNSRPMWANIFGGIFLFDRTIPANSEYKPLGTTMIGNGSYGTVNSGTPLCLGTYDSIKSGMEGDTLTMVYNWTQAQGNGSIASVCLTSRVGGYIGYGNTDGTQTSTLKVFEEDQSFDSIGGDSHGSGIIYNNRRYKLVLDNTAKEVTVYKTYFQVNKVDVVDLALGETSTTYTYNTALVGPLGAGALPATWISDGKNKLAIGGISEVADGATFPILIYDMQNDTLTEHIITNNTGETLRESNHGWDSRNNGLCGFDGTNIFVAKERSWRQGGNSTTVYGIRISDSSVVMTFSDVYADTIQSVKQFVPNIYYVTKESSICVYDSINNTMLPINSYDGDFYQIGYDQIADIITVNNTEYFRNNTACIIGYKNPMYLATVNNLAQSVIKTNEDSMSVTYTLEDVSS